MENLPINVLDLTLIGVLIVFGLFGLGLGLVRSSLYVLSWIGAGFVSFYAFPTVKPLAREYIEQFWIADAAAVFGVFVIAMAIFVLASSMVGVWIRNSQLNALDRSFGMLAGLGVAAVAVCGGYIGYSYYTPVKEQPDWVHEAKALPLIETGSVAMLTLVPPEWLNRGRKAADGAKKSATDAQTKIEQGSEASRILQEMLHPETNAPAKPQKKDGYSNRERNEMERLIDGSQ